MGRRHDDQRERQQTIARGLGLNRPRFAEPHMRGPMIGAVVRQFRVMAIDEDHLECVYWDGEDEGDDTILVMKPWLLRRTPFDGKTRWHVSYDYTSDHEREATDTLSNETETQVIVPRYVVEADGGDAGPDTIYAIATVVGGLSQAADYNDNNKLGWLDLNVDGRAWATKTETP